MTFQLEKLDHIQLSAPKGSEETAKKFYRDILGFAEEEKPESLKANGGVWFNKGDIALHIWNRGTIFPYEKSTSCF